MDIEAITPGIMFGHKNTGRVNDGRSTQKCFFQKTDTFFIKVVRQPIGLQTQITGPTASDQQGALVDVPDKKPWREIIGAVHEVKQMPVFPAVQSLAYGQGKTYIPICAIALEFEKFIEITVNESNIKRFVGPYPLHPYSIIFERQRYLFAQRENFGLMPHVTERSCNSIYIGRYSPEFLAFSDKFGR